MFKLHIHILNLQEHELPDLVNDPCCPSTASSTAKLPVNDKSSPLIVSDDEAEQEKDFDDSLIKLEDYEAPERNGNGTDYGDEDVMIIDEIPDIPEKNAEGKQTNTKGDQDKDKISNR